MSTHTSEDSLMAILGLTGHLRVHSVDQERARARGVREESGAGLSPTKGHSGVHEAVDLVGDLGFDSASASAGAQNEECMNGGSA